ncbi:MAG TPA: retropepsin-like aspartic protease [Ignavibacteria bacterium]|nr:retropepsin-like aspartic protease [Ignavibacteria bacterium]
MKKLILILIFMIISNQLTGQTKFQEALSIYESDKYFEFIKFYSLNSDKLSEIENSILNGLILCLQNEPEKSNELLLSHSKNEKIDLKIRKALIESIINNYVHLYEYKKAAEMSKDYLESYKESINSNDREEIENSLIIWEGFKDTKKQEVKFSGKKNLNYTKDLAELINIKVKSNSEEINFVFDTGANFSTVTKSTALKMGMKFVDGTIKVGTITGIKVDAELAYAKEFFIGDIECKNVLFLVLPDEALSFGGGVYKISGIIGLPLIKDLKEITINRNNMITLNSDSKKDSHQNLLLDGFMPVIEVVYQNDSLDFTFDTGARTTLLYSPFYEKYKKFIDENYKLTQVKFGGAGGEKSFNGFNIEAIKFTIGNSTNEIKDISLISEKIADKKKKMYGNLGQDFLGKYDNLVIDFKSMKVQLY